MPRSAESDQKRKEKRREERKSYRRAFKIVEEELTLVARGEQSPEAAGAAIWRRCVQEGVLKVKEGGRVDVGDLE